MIHLSSNLKYLRKTKGLSQKELADAISVNKSQIGSWEEGRATPKYENLIKLVNFFEVKTDTFLTHNMSRFYNISEYTSNKSMVKEPTPPFNNNEESKPHNNRIDKLTELNKLLEKRLKEKDERIEEYQERIKELGEYIQLLKKVNKNPEQ